MEHLGKIEGEETHIALPVQGAVLAARVRITIASGLVDVNWLLRQAAIRRIVVVQLIRMRRDADHPAYRGIDIRGVQRRARELASTDGPGIPSELVEFLEGADEVAGEFFSGVDKAATSTERAYSQADHCRNLERARPQTLVVQRDADANRNVESSRESALFQFSSLLFQTGSKLTQQFESEYQPRVFCTTLPWCVGCHDFPRRQRLIRTYEDFRWSCSTCTPP